MEENVLNNEVNTDIDNNTETSPTEKANTKKQKYYCETSLYTFFSVFGVVFMAFYLCFQVLLNPIQVVGRSMQPTINISVTSETDNTHSDIVYYSKNDHYNNDDIVIVSNQKQQYIKNNQVEFFIKRVIACPGQTIIFFLTDIESEGLVRNYLYEVVVKDENGNVVQLDDSYLNEPMQFSSTEYLFSESEWFKQIFANLQNILLPMESRKCEITMGENEYFVMGDNRSHSDDSRVLGIISYNDISGSVKLHIPYGKSLFYAVWNKIKSLF